MKAPNNSKPAKIEFRVSEEEISETPRLNAIVLQQMIRQPGLEQIAIELEMEKHHGISIHDIIFTIVIFKL